MELARHPRSATAALLLVGAAALVAWGLHATRLDPDVPFLPDAAGAEWITYPLEPSTATRRAVPWTTSFQSLIHLAEAPGRAHIRWRAFREAELQVDHVTVDATGPADGSWKRVREVDVAANLHAGTNQITVHVRNGRGPPALWLLLETEERNLVSNEAWIASLMGATPQPARSAREPMNRWSQRPEWHATTGAGLETPGDALRGRAARLLVWALLGALAGVAASRIGVRGEPGASGTPLPVRACAVLVAACALLWAVLLWNNAEVLHRFRGFDAEGHVEYLAMVLERVRLPLADEGWEAYQPPLYYLLAAGAMALSGHRVVDEAAADAARAVNGAAAVLAAASVLLALRVAFPARRRLQVFGFAVAVFLPAQLYAAQYLSNEVLAGALVSLATWLALRIGMAERTSARACGVLGLVLGAALLTKVTALIASVVLPAVLLGRWILVERAGARAVLARTGALAGAALAVCGWHYARVAARFGRPLVGNWDAESGWAWWQDPGYHVADYYTGFGHALVAPVFAGMRAFGDALHGTLWCDGLIGGAQGVEWAPPWDLEAMAAGSGLGVAIGVALLLGAGRLGVGLLRGPDARGFLLLGLGGGVAFAVFAMTLRLPFYAQARSIYALSALVPLCACAALGLDGLAALGSPGRVVIPAILAAWAGNSFDTYLADAGAERNQLAMARAYIAEGRADAAEERFRRVPGLEDAAASGGRIAQLRARGALYPDRVGRWLAEVDALDPVEDAERVEETLRLALGFEPDDPEIHRRLARLLLERGEATRALEPLGFALAIEPGDVETRRALATTLRGLGRDEEAARVLRRVRKSPD